MKKLSLNWKNKENKITLSHLCHHSDEMCAGFLIIEGFTWFYPQHATMVVNGKFCAQITALDLRTNRDSNETLQKGWKRKKIYSAFMTFSSDLISQLDARSYLEEVSDWSPWAGVSVHCLHFVDATPRCRVLCTQTHTVFKQACLYRSHSNQNHFWWPGSFKNILWNLNDVIKYNWKQKQDT